MSDTPRLVPTDDDDERTTIVDRADATPQNEDDERTTVVERTAPRAEPDDERTTIVERTALDLDDERTTLVERTALDLDDERTTMVERSSPLDDDERTTIVDRTAPPVEHDDDGTVIVSRAPDPVADGDDHSATVIVGRAHETAERPAAGTSAGRPAGGSSSKKSTGTGRRGRRRITLPPVEPGFGAEPVDAVGPGAIATYTPRTIAPPPVTVAAVPLGADATRAPAPSMPSVGKRSRTIGMVAVGGFALACVVSVVGLVTIVVAILP